MDAILKWLAELGIKSAEVLDGAEKVAKYYVDLIARDDFRKAFAPGYSISVKDGEARFRKPTGFISAKGGMKKPEPSVVMQLCEERGIKGMTPALADRVIPYFASDERVDGQGDIVKQEWLFDEYKTNPVLCNSHQWEQPPIGAGLDWKVVSRKEDDYDGPALALLAYFASPEQGGYPEDRLYRLASCGILRAGSVGFFSDKTIDVKDEAERAKLGLGRWGAILASNHLLEFSPCTIGANAGALSQLASAAKSGGVKAEDMAVVRELTRQAFAAKGFDGWKAKDAEIVNLARTVFRDFSFPKHEDAEKPFGAEELEAFRLRHYTPKAPLPGTGQGAPKPGGNGIDQTKPTPQPASDANGEPNPATQDAEHHKTTQQMLGNLIAQHKQSHELLAAHAAKIVTHIQALHESLDNVHAQLQQHQDAMDSLAQAHGDIRDLLEKLVAGATPENGNGKPGSAPAPAKPQPEKGGNPQADEPLGALATRLVLASQELDARK